MKWAICLYALLLRLYSGWFCGGVCRTPAAAKERPLQGGISSNLPFVAGERGAFILLASIMAVQWALSRIHTMQLG